MYPAMVSPSVSRPVSDDTTSISRRSLVITSSALGALTLVGFLLGYVLAPSPPPEPPGSTGPAVLENRDRLGAPLLVAGGLDTFDIDSPGSLGAMPGGPSWRAVRGGWAVALGEAYPASPAPGRSLAVVALGQGDGAAQVRVARLTQGSGVVFRYRDPSNYWYVAAVPAYGSWSVVKVLDGQEQTVANTGTSSVKDGTTVGVRFQGQTIDVAIDGVVRASVSDGALSTADGVGMAVWGSDAAKARFDDFRAALANGQPPPP